MLSRKEVIKITPKEQNEWNEGYARARDLDSKPILPGNFRFFSKSFLAGYAAGIKLNEEELAAAGNKYDFER